MTTPTSLSSARYSRRTLFKGAGAAGLAIVAAGAIEFDGNALGVMKAAAADSESVQDIINIAATAESLAVTALGGAIEAANGGKYNKPIPDPVKAILQAARAEEQFHLDYLMSAGAKPLTQSFTVPDPKILSDYDTLFKTVVTLETAFIAAYMQAAKEFAQMGHPELAKVAYQIGGVECEHRVLANYALGTRPANDVAFEKAMFGSVGDAAAALKNGNWLGGGAVAVSYPGPGTIDKAGVEETTPGGPTVQCTMPGAPATGGGGLATHQSQNGLEQMLGLLGLFGVGTGAVAMLSRRLRAEQPVTPSND